MCIMFNIVHCLKYRAAEIQFESSNYLKFTNQYTEYIYFYTRQLSPLCLWSTGDHIYGAMLIKSIFNVQHMSGVGCTTVLN